MDPRPLATEAQPHATMILAEPGASQPGRRTTWWTLPEDVLGESVRRIRVLAWLYALAYFLAGLFPALLTAENRRLMFSMPGNWVPCVASILGGIAVALLLGLPRLSAQLKARLGLVFEVLASIGIAAAEYRQVASPILVTKDLLPAGFGLSWVAPWVMLFSVVVPARPLTVLVPAALSLASVPIAYAVGVATGSNVPLHGDVFFFALVFPYIIVLLMAYVGSRVVYRLGTAVREARELGSYRLRERLGARRHGRGVARASTACSPVPRRSS